MKPEMILLVDENDIAIGKIEREKKKAPQIHRVSALWLKNNQGEILLAKRHKNKATNPGLW
jgi:isopentenyldiphosphate isomerase